eukprot:TRINITY_DN3576_c0_g1_i1.p1 TRINITY_DN3576_c0_g1~~TRINITY_DN3576_c0_g1_i1.p1  ORF type:complete len:1028 (+),score=284.51 TRINITY_DN3576_c0_g1_i1:59-3142(+)
MGCCGGKEADRPEGGIQPPKAHVEDKIDKGGAPTGRRKKEGIEGRSKSLGLFAIPPGLLENGQVQVPSVRCDGCGALMIRDILPFCPKTIFVNLKNGLQFTPDGARCQATVHETVAALTRHEAVQLKKLRKTQEKTDYSATRIQRWWRRALLKRRWFGTIFHHLYKKLDKWQERDKHSVKKIYRAATHMEGDTSIRPETARPSQHTIVWPPEALHNSPEKDNIVKAVMAIVSNNDKIPPSFVKPLLVEAEAHLKKRPNIQHVTLQANSSCVVVGDLHGQLADLLRILREFGLPDANRHYVFNGDFVDRGPKGCEVTCLLLTLLLAYPARVFMNRGNHEDEPMCENYEFMEEALNKYSATNYQRFLRVFRALPLCTIVHDEVFVVHGGVPRDPVTLNDINKINRFRDIPMVTCKTDAFTTPDKRMVADMTWSDPVDDEPIEGFPEHKAYMHNMDRGNGIWYRKEHTEAFLTRNNLRLVIRSHEAPDSGFAIHHNSMAITIFSASYYAGVQRNDGAVAVITLHSERSLPPSGPQGLSAGKVVIGFDTWKVYEEGDDVQYEVNGVCAPPSLQGASTIEAVLRIIRDFVHDHRHRLMTVFASRDELLKTGSVGCLDWSQIMRDVSGCQDVPWEFIRPWVAEAVWPESTEEVTGTSSIPFTAFLRRFAVPLENRLFRKWAPHIVRWIWHRGSSSPLMNDNADPRTLFDYACPNGGLMTYNRFFSLIVNDLQTQLSSDIVFLLFCFFDQDGGMPGYLRRDSFAKHFKEAEVHGVQSEEVEEEVDEKEVEWIAYDNSLHMWDYWLVQRLRDHVKRCVSPAAAFKVFDQDGDGVLGIGDLKAAIGRLQLSRLQCPARRTTYKFAATPKSAKEDAEIVTVGELFGLKAGSLKMMGTRDPITHNMQAVISTWPPSDDQLASLLHNLDYDSDGKVTYNDFIQAFYVVDLNEAGLLAPYHEPVVPKKHSFQSYNLLEGPSSPKKALEQACASFRKVRTRSGSVISEVYPAPSKNDAFQGIEMLSDESESTDSCSEKGET